MNTLPLEKIGLTRNEANVYIALLRLGQTTTGPLVKESKVSRSKVYDILERLKNKGLISYILKENIKYFSASNPRNIIDYLSSREDEIRKSKKIIEGILPSLDLYQNIGKEKRIAEIYIGYKGMENIFNVLIDELDPNEKWYALGAGKAGETNIRIRRYFDRLHKKRIEKGVKSLIIFNETSRGSFPTQENSKYVEARYLNQSTPAAINIYKNNTIIAILVENPISILISKKEVAESFKEHFKIMWKMAKD